jgi:beta-aspartyl-dipeptidase (metallo-type)
LSTNALLIRQAEVFAPEPLGRADLLIIGRRLAAVGTLVGLAGLPGLRREHLPRSLVVPGFVDQHVHVAGAGGEGGFQYRTPPVAVADLLAAGITAVVGLLGTDGVTRSAIGLLAEVRRLAAHGISAYMYSGAYWVPSRTITASLREDLVVVPEVLGAGEIAVSDHRGSQPDPVALDRLAREVYLGALLAGKLGVLHLHLGDEDSGLEPVLEAWRRSALPIRLFRPTHLNRKQELLEAALAFARAGGVIDLTAGIAPGPGDPLPVAPADAFSALREQGVPLSQLTLSSDANGSSPVLAPDGELRSLTVVHPRVLLEAVRALAQRLPLPEALAPVTRTPADGLGLRHLGRIAPSARAHLLVLSQELELQRVYLGGELAYADGAALPSGPYETRRSATAATASRYAGPGASPRRSPGSKGRPNPSRGGH